MLYHTLITPYFNYCTLTWANSSQTHIERLFKLPKKGHSFITHSHFQAHTNPLFHKLNILNINDLGSFHIAIFMCLCFNEKLPNFLAKFFHLNMDIHDYNTRSALDY